MKRILQCEQAPLGFMSVVVLRASVGAGELQRSFPCLSAAVAEECFLKSRDLCELFRQLGLKFVDRPPRSHIPAWRNKIAAGFPLGPPVGSALCPRLSSGRARKPPAWAAFRPRSLRVPPKKPLPSCSAKASPNRRRPSPRAHP